MLLAGCGPSVPDVSIHAAAGEGNIEAVKRHIAAGADVNVKDDDGDWKDGQTPLHYAASRSHKEIIKLLIAKGPDVNAKDKSSMVWTPLETANNQETADILRKHGGKTSDKLKAAGN